MKRESGPTTTDPFRKRSFDPQRDVALMAMAFEQENPGMKMSWHINQALRLYFTERGYTKKGAALQALFLAPKGR
jgi:hypothetical protein